MQDLAALAAPHRPRTRCYAYALITADTPQDVTILHYRLVRYLRDVPHNALPGAVHDMVRDAVAAILRCEGWAVVEVEKAVTVKCDGVAHELYPDISCEGWNCQFYVEIGHTKDGGKSYSEKTNKYAGARVDERPVFVYALAGGMDCEVTGLEVLAEDLAVICGTRGRIDVALMDRLNSNITRVFHEGKRLRTEDLAALEQACHDYPDVLRVLRGDGERAPVAAQEPAPMPMPAPMPVQVPEPEPLPVPAPQPDADRSALEPDEPSLFVSFASQSSALLDLEAPAGLPYDPLLLRDERMPN